MEASTRLLAVVVGDLHIGRSWTAHSTPTTRPQLRQKYYEPLQEAVSKYSGKLISAGDWFDRSNNDEQTILNSMQWMDNFKVVLAGNHDISNRKDAVSSLQLISQTLNRPSALSVTKPSTVIAVPSDFNRPEVFTVPLSPEVTAWMAPHQPSQEAFVASLEMAMEQAAGAWQETKNILVCHCNYGSGEGKSNSDLYLSPAMQARLEDVFDLVFLGHEHLPVKIGRTIITGSCQPCNFGELGPRFFWEIHFDIETHQLTVQQVPIASAMRHLVLNLATVDLAEANTELWNGEELVRLTGPVKIEDAGKVQELVKKFYASGALAVKLDVEFFTGASPDDSEKVSMTMQNLVERVRAEVEGNSAWAELLEEVLQTTVQPVGG